MAKILKIAAYNPEQNRWDQYDIGGESDAANITLTSSVIGADNVKSALESLQNGKVSKNGDTLYGSISVVSSYSAKPGEDVNTITFGGVNIKDKNNTYTFYSENRKTASDNLYQSFCLRRTINDQQINNGFYLNISSAGNRSVTWPSGQEDACKEAWRKGLAVYSTTEFPKNHAVNANTYGYGTTGVYGHVKLVDNLATSKYTAGLALSANQGYTLNSSITTLNTKVTALNSSHAWSSSTTKSVANKTNTRIASVAIPEKGIWLLTGWARFPNNATGVRALGLTTYATATWTSGDHALGDDSLVSCQAANGNWTQLRSVYLYKTTAAATVYTYVYHEAGTALATTSNIQRIRVGNYF